MSGQIIQLGASLGQFFALDENGGRTPMPPVEAEALEPVPAKPKVGKVVARIGADPAPVAPRRSYAAELRERRKFLEREVKRLRKFETELREVDQMLAAIKTTARKTS